MSYPLTPELRVAASAALIQRRCVNVIKTDAIKAEAAGRWDKTGAAVVAQLESLLRQKLGPSDFFAAVDDTTFIVSMPSSDAEASQVLCLRVAHELHTTFLGRCKIGQLRIAEAVGIVNDGIEVADIQGDTLNRLALRAGLGCDEEFLNTPRTLSTNAAKPAPPQFREMFVPLWDAKREAITAHRCITASPPAVVGIATQEQFKRELGAALSRIARAARTLTAHIKAGDRFLLVVTISYDLLASPIGRMEITSACRALSAVLRPYLVFEIGDLPFGVPQSRLLELVGVLRPFCRAVAGQLPARISSYGIYQGAGLTAISLSLTANGVGATEMHSEVFKLCTAARRLHILSLVSDALTEEAVSWACEQGVNYVCGPFIGGPAPEPHSVRRLTLADMRETWMAAARRSALISA